MNTQTIGEEHAGLILKDICDTGLAYSYLRKGHQLIIEENQEELLRFRLPITILSPETYSQSPQDKPNYVLLLVRSGQAAIGYFENGENMGHKVFRAYMVRKKQGKSQIKHLKTKGKSRAGSRVRLAETLEFFENINQRLNDYFNTYRVDLIGISCATTLIPYLYGSKTPTPFEKNDNRIIKIPKHIPQPTYDSLLETNDFLLKGELKYQENGKALIQKWMGLYPTSTYIQEEDEDDW